MLLLLTVLACGGGSDGPPRPAEPRSGPAPTPARVLDVPAAPPGCHALYAMALIGERQCTVAPPGETFVAGQLSGPGACALAWSPGDDNLVWVIAPDGPGVYDCTVRSCRSPVIAVGEDVGAAPMISGLWTAEPTRLEGGVQVGADCEGARFPGPRFVTSGPR